MAPLRVLLVEDNEVYRSSLELLLALRGGIEVAGVVGDGAAVPAAVAELAPDVVLMDYRLPGVDGAAATAALRRDHPDVAVVCLTAEATPEERSAILAAGAASLVEKGTPIDRVVEAVRAAAGTV